MAPEAINAPELLGFRDRHRSSQLGKPRHKVGRLAVRCGASVLAAPSGPSPHRACATTYSGKIAQPPASSRSGPRDEFAASGAVEAILQISVGEAGGMRARIWVRAQGGAPDLGPPRRPAATPECRDTISRRYRSITASYSAISRRYRKTPGRYRRISRRYCRISRRYRTFSRRYRAASGCADASPGRYHPISERYR